MSLIFKALSDEKRLQIFELIRRDEAKCEASCCEISEQACCVGEIAAKIDLSQPTVSHHLKELRNADLVEVEKKGVWVYCRINHQTVQKAAEFLQGREAI